MKFEAHVEDDTIELELDGDVVIVEGERTDVHATRLTDRTIHLLVGPRSYVLTLERLDDKTVRVTHRGHTREVRLRTERDLLLDRLGMSAEPEAAAQELRAPMPGLVLSVLVEPGEEVEPGRGLVVLEAMKMENELRAEATATVAAVHVEPGTAVSKDELLVTFE